MEWDNSAVYTEDIALKILSLLAELKFYYSNNILEIRRIYLYLHDNIVSVSAELMFYYYHNILTIWQIGLHQPHNIVNASAELMF